MGVFGLRSVASLTIVFGGLLTLAAAGIAQPQTAPRPPIGGFGSPPNAMIFYVRAAPPARADRAARNGLLRKAPFSGTPTSG